MNRSSRFKERVKIGSLKFSDTDQDSIGAAKPKTRAAQIRKITLEMNAPRLTDFSLKVQPFEFSADDRFQSKGARCNQI